MRYGFELEGQIPDVCAGTALDKRSQHSDAQGSKGEAHDRVERRSLRILARRVAKESLAQVRRSVAALRPAEITMGAFDAALRRLVSEYTLVSRDVEVSLDLEEATQELSPLLRATLYRCAQEALTNIRKHAHATKVLRRLRTEEQQVELTVLNNGQGMASQTETHPPGFGLLGMRERVGLLGGRVQAAAEPGRGWRVEVVLPRGTQEEPAPSRSLPLRASKGS